MIHTLLNSMREISTKVVGINQRNAQLICPNNPRPFHKLANDKIIAKEILSENEIPCAETYLTISRISEIAEALKKMQQFQSLAIKPANGKGGGGIMILRKGRNGQWTKGEKPIAEWKILQHLANIISGVFSGGKSDRVLVEYCIKPHHFFHQIYPIGVPDFRIILLKEQLVMAMLRVPTDKSEGKANLHQGGLGIGIDLEEGKLNKAFDGKRYLLIHPDSGTKLKGLEIPYWDEMLNISLKTASVFPLDYLGVDIVLDEALGPLVMEVNVRPGLGIQLVNQCGLREIKSVRHHITSK